MVSYSFLPKIISSFYDYENIYIVTNIFNGKSLNYFRDKILTEDQIKFVSACVIESLTYLRKEKIIHRDIMMKNIIMDNDKYFNVIDFSYSINYLNKNDKINSMITYNMVTPPEILNNSDYDYNSDYYRLGSIIYYLIFKKYPYMIKSKYKNNDVYINPNVINNYSNSCVDFLNKLLISDYQKRIGYNDINELKKHIWFKSFNWTQLKKKEILSPFFFIRNDINNFNCKRKKFFFPMNLIIRFRLKEKSLFFKKLINSFNYANTIIILKK